MKIRRYVCLRIDGIPIVPNETCTYDVLRNVREKWEGSEGMQEKWKKEGIQPIPDSVIDRAHRIGKVYKNNTDNVESQSVILRLSTFRHRTQIFLAHKLMKDVSIKLDLTKYRYSTLREAREHVDKIAGVKFVFVDINCRLKVRLINGKVFSFESMDELDKILNKEL